MNKFEIGIVDTRNIIKMLQDVYDYDFKNYALTFFKRRVENFIRIHNLKNADFFIQRIEQDKEVFESFLSFMSVDITEMFRDPSLWRLLKDELLNTMIPGSTSFKIWFPEVSSGEELYSMAILLKKMNLSQNVKFYASSISELNIEKIKTGIFDPKKVEVNNANYKRIFSEGELSNFYTQENEKAFWDTSLIESTKFIKQNIIFDDYPKGIKLILFRNQMIYYNQILQERFLKIMHHCLVPGGHLIIGNNEKIDYWNSDKDYITVSKSESVYKKKLS
ncbi:MAG: CheR family methyltransferase [Bacteroidales bacterium]|jgi:chemotaxis protein methyltransferase CheR|nr:CheR family methyltransferase [Bacteroidales bacterium]